MAKKDIHPKYYPKAKVQCACGNTFTVGSTKEFIEIEICSKCHPFYSGKGKIIDKMGRVERFKKRLAKKRDYNPPTVSKRPAERKRVTGRSESRQGRTPIKKHGK